MSTKTRRFQLAVNPPFDSLVSVPRLRTGKLRQRVASGSSSGVAPGALERLRAARTGGFESQRKLHLSLPRGSRVGAADAGVGTLHAGASDGAPVGSVCDGSCGVPTASLQIISSLATMADRSCFTSDSSCFSRASEAASASSWRIPSARPGARAPIRGRARRGPRRGRAAVHVAPADFRGHSAK